MSMALMREAVAGSGIALDEDRPPGTPYLIRCLELSVPLSNLWERLKTEFITKS
jgi:hypothetical protein